MHIFLTGFMGCGKSTTGRNISMLTGMTLLDTDEYIEKKDGRRISLIFEQSGEGYFRRLETIVLKEIREMPDCIISCGGGMVLRDENVELMKSCGKIVYLTATPETILSRVESSDRRPILEGNKNIEFISNLMRGRLPFYEAAADIRVATDGRDSKEVAKEVLALV